jgi:hypothetical protein
MDLNDASSRAKGKGRGKSIQEEDVIEMTKQIRDPNFTEKCDGHGEEFFFDSRIIVSKRMNGVVLRKFIMIKQEPSALQGC